MSLSVVVEPNHEPSSFSSPAARRLPPFRQHGKRPCQPVSATSSSTNSLLEPRSNLPLRSDAYVVVNPKTGETLAERNANRVMSIASITKLMTALVVLDGNQRLTRPSPSPWMTWTDSRARGRASRWALA